MTTNHFFRTLRLSLVLAVLAIPGAAAAAWDDCDGWEQRDRGSSGRYCEVRELTLTASGAFDRQLPGEESSGNKAARRQPFGLGFSQSGFDPAKRAWVPGSVTDWAP